MIAQLTGIVTHKDGGSIILDVAGVGYRIFVSPDTLEQLHEQKEDSASLFTHLSVRENALDLYGFLEQEELHFFEMLISISGIGPKSALAILSIADIQTMKQAILSGDSSYLTKVSGIGIKNAQKIVLELNDKIEVHGDTGEPALREDMDTFEALKSLGYSTLEARETLKQIPRTVSGTRNRLRQALKLLGK